MTVPVISGGKYRIFLDQQTHNNCRGQMTPPTISAPIMIAVTAIPPYDSVRYRLQRPMARKQS